MFGWTPCQCLEMPASRFFSVFVAAQRVRFAEDQMKMAALCDISAISLANPKYYETVKRGFIDAARAVYPIHMNLVQPEENKAVDAGSDTAREIMFGAVRAVKGGPSV